MRTTCEKRKHYTQLVKKEKVTHTTDEKKSIYILGRVKSENMARI
jgi:hypothetical protein